MSERERQVRQQVLPEDLRPTQQQLRDLRATVFNYEPKIEPFMGLPAGIDLNDFEILASPPTFDETIAPSTTLRAPDKRVIWLSVFRNPDTNRVLRPSIMILDPPINRDERKELPREDYEILEVPLGRLAIERFSSPPMTSVEVTALQSLIVSSEEFNGFLEI